MMASTETIVTHRHHDVDECVRRLTGLVNYYESRSSLTPSDETIIDEILLILRPPLEAAIAMQQRQTYDYDTRTEQIVGSIPDLPDGFPYDRSE